MDVIKILVLMDDDVDFNPIHNESENHLKNFDIVRINSDIDIYKILDDNVCIIVTAETNDNNIFLKYPRLHKLPSYIKTRWLNFYNIVDYDSYSMAREILNFYARAFKFQTEDFFSIITPLYNTRKDVFDRTYDSLKKQINPNWEWVIVDDSPDKDKTKYIQKYIDDDFRIKYYPLEHSGNIGKVKYTGFSLGRGKYLLELDHDDILLPTALQRADMAFNSNPEIGFVYSDCLELQINKYGEPVGVQNYSRDENGNPTMNPWGVSNTGGVGEYTYKGVNVYYNISPNINPQTIRTITAMPNHFRCWRKDVYQKIRGHRTIVPVADDYELMVRTFLNTRFCHIKSLEYIQFYEIDGVVNTQYKKYGEIQRITTFASRVYDEDIHNRIIELGKNDYCWDDVSKQSIWWNVYSTPDILNNKMEFEI